MKYLDKGHHIFADWFYSSVPLVEELKKRGSGFTGTLVRNRLYFPGEVKAKKFQVFQERFSPTEIKDSGTFY